MSDVFISYASVDRDSARIFAHVLESRGLSVWWDRTIVVGETFDEVIEKALQSVCCVVVLWSRASVASSWVKSEAAEGARRRVLIPLRIDDVQLPLEFRRIQTADLLGWNGEVDHPGFQQAWSAIRRYVAGSPEPDVAPVSTAGPDRRRGPLRFELRGENGGYNTRLLAVLYFVGGVLLNFILAVATDPAASSVDERVDLLYFVVLPIAAFFKLPVSPFRIVAVCWLTLMVAAFIIVPDDKTVWGGGAIAGILYLLAATAAWGARSLWKRGVLRRG
jgi:hypothetical protein